MAHMLEHDKSMAYAGETPWHGLGVRVSNDISVDEMMKAAGLDWTVEKIPTYATIGGKKVQMDRSALVRSSDNTVFDLVPNDWNEVQNHEAFEFYREWVENGGMEMHTAGSLDNGR